jgi:D-alanyl-D-alanine dipeptidase
MSGTTTHDTTTHRPPAADRPIERTGNDPATLPPVPVLECGEPLVVVKDEPRIFTAAAYHAWEVPGAPDTVAVRRGVLAALGRAAAGLPPGTGLLLLDGVRTLATQHAIVELFRSSLARGHGGDEDVEKYLALAPETRQAFLADPPPHATGGAVDLTLCDAEGRQLDLGAEFDQFDESAWLAHFEQPEHVRNAADETFARNRRVLYWAMLEAGFAPYPWEYWHYEWGTPVAAVFHGATLARYGAAVPFSSRD